METVSVSEFLRCERQEGEFKNRWISGATQWLETIIEQRFTWICSSLSSALWTETACKEKRGNRSLAWLEEGGTTDARKEWWDRKEAENTRRHFWWCSTTEGRAVVLVKEQIRGRVCDVCCSWRLLLNHICTKHLTSWPEQTWFLSLQQNTHTLSGLSRGCYSLKEQEGLLFRINW